MLVWFNFVLRVIIGFKFYAIKLKNQIKLELNFILTKIYLEPNNS